MVSERGNDVDIAVLRSELNRVNERLRLLEEKNEATMALMNKWGGGIAVGIILAGAVWALFLAFSANFQKTLGH